MTSNRCCNNTFSGVAIHAPFSCKSANRRISYYLKQSGTTSKLDFNTHEFKQHYKDSLLHPFLSNQPQTERWRVILRGRELTRERGVKPSEKAQKNTEMEQLRGHGRTGTFRCKLSETLSHTPINVVSLKPPHSPSFSIL